MVESNSSPRKNLDESKNDSATVTASGLAAFTAARHSRQKSSGTHGATSMRQPDAPRSSHCFITESRAPYANARKLGELLLTSGRSGVPVQPRYCLLGSCCVGSNAYQSAYGESARI